MRCSCRYCDSEAYMIHSESDMLGCVCPVCGARCRDCLGTDTLMSREAIEAMKRAAHPRDDEKPDA